MQTLRHIVVGTDFSEDAEQAVKAAISLGNFGVTRITLVHVCALSAERRVPDHLIGPELDDELLRHCEERLTRAVARRRDGGFEVTGVLRTGRPWEKLNNVAAEVGAGLIVIGRHGEGGSGCELGTVAERVLRTASRPVLVVPRDPTVGLLREAP